METCAPLTIYKRGRVEDVHGKAVTWATQVFSVFPPVLGCDTKYISIIHFLFKQQQQKKMVVGFWWQHFVIYLLTDVGVHRWLTSTHSQWEHTLFRKKENHFPWNPKALSLMLEIVLKVAKNKELMALHQIYFFPEKVFKKLTSCDFCPGPMS